MQTMAGIGRVNRIDVDAVWQRFAESKLVFPLIVLAVDPAVRPDLRSRASSPSTVIDGHLFGNVVDILRTRARRSCCSRSA